MQSQALKNLIFRPGQAGRQTGRQADRQAGRQAGRQVTEERDLEIIREIWTQPKLPYLSLALPDCTTDLEVFGKNPAKLLGNLGELLENPPQNSPKTLFHFWGSSWTCFFISQI